MIKIGRSVAISALLIFYTAQGSADIYKGFDKDCRVTFSNIPRKGFYPLSAPFDAITLQDRCFDSLNKTKKHSKKKQPTKEERIEREKKEEQARIEREKKEEEARQESQRILDAMKSAKEKARFPCRGKSNCEKSFSLTQIYVSEKSDMRIQLATDTIIETHNPLSPLNIGIKAVKIPQKLDHAEIRIVASCNDDKGRLVDSCNKLLADIYEKFPRFMQDMVK